MKKRIINYRLKIDNLLAVLLPWNSEPFMCSVIVSYNAAAVITENKTAFLTYGTKKFTAL